MISHRLVEVLLVGGIHGVARWRPSLLLLLLLLHPFVHVLHRRRRTYRQSAMVVHIVEAAVVRLHRTAGRNDRDAAGSGRVQGRGR